MYSPAVAQEEGRRIGRRLSNIWLSDEELSSVVMQEILPQVRPRSGAIHREAESTAGVAGGLLVLGLLALALLFAVVIYRDAEWMPDALSMLDMRWLWWIPIILVALAALANLQHRTAVKNARTQRQRLREQLFRAAYAGAAEVITARRTRELNARQAQSARTTPGAARGSSADGGNVLTPRQAEELAARWMRALGAEEVRVTQFSGDGGVDVTSSKYIAQVKHFAGNVGVAPIRELSGVVRVDGRRGLFFVTNGYAPGAIEFAHRSGIALFTMNHRTGQLMAVNEVAQALQKHGLG